MELKIPKTYMIGYTTVDEDELFQYLRDTDQEDFIQSYKEAIAEGLQPGEILTSFYAKLCYSSLVLGKNANIKRTRDIRKNIEHTMEVGHGSVFEHFGLNFVTTDCSRIFTHELVRHRVGTAFSQTSGRYVALDNINIVFDPILDPVKHIGERIVAVIEEGVKEMREVLDVANQTMTVKKQMTSAIRRFAPNGQTNEVGWTCNIRSIRHIILMRTNGAAEWEIRMICGQAADKVLAKFPLMMYSLTTEEVNGLDEWTGPRL